MAFLAASHLPQGHTAVEGEVSTKHGHQPRCSLQVADSSNLWGPPSGVSKEKLPSTPFSQSSPRTDNSLLKFACQKLTRWSHVRKMDSALPAHNDIKVSAPAYSGNWWGDVIMTGIKYAVIVFTQVGSRLFFWPQVCLSQMKQQGKALEDLEVCIAGLQQPPHDSHWSSDSLVWVSCGHVWSRDHHWQ